MSYQIINGIIDRALPYFNHVSKEDAQFEEDFQKDLPSIDHNSTGESETTPTSESTKVRTDGFNYKKLPIDHVLRLANLDNHEKHRAELLAAQSAAIKQEEERKVYEELLNKLIPIYADDNRKSKSINIKEYKELVEPIKKARAYCSDSALLKKLELSDRALDSLIKLLQHKSANVQQDMKKISEKINLAINQFDTVVKELLQMVKMLNETNKSIARAR